MELGGNKNAKEYFSRVGVPLVGDVYDYSHEKVTKYKNDLSNRVRDSFGNSFESSSKIEESVPSFKNVEAEKNDKMFEEIVEKKEVISNTSLISRGGFKVLWIHSSL